MQFTMQPSVLDKWINGTKKRRIIIDDTDCDVDGSVVVIEGLPAADVACHSVLPNPFVTTIDYSPVPPIISADAPCDSARPLAMTIDRPPVPRPIFAGLPEGDDLPDFIMITSDEDSDSASNDEASTARTLSKVFGGCDASITPFDLNLWKAIPRASSQFLDLEADHKSDGSAGNRSLSSGELSEGFISEHDDVATQHLGTVASGDPVSVNVDMKWMRDNLPITVQRCAEVHKSIVTHHE